MTFGHWVVICDVIRLDRDVQDDCEPWSEPVTDESSEDCDAASDQTDADEEEADEAIEEL